MQATQSSAAFAPRPIRSGHAAGGSFLGRVLRSVRSWHEAYAWRRRVARTQRALYALDDRTLRDIGLHRSEVDSVVFELRGLGPAQRRHSGARRRAT